MPIIILILVSSLFSQITPKRILIDSSASGGGSQWMTVGNLNQNLDSVFTISSDAIATVPAGTTKVLITASLTVSRAVTMPLAARYKPGFCIPFIAVSAAGAVGVALLTRAGSDLINGATTFGVITTATRFGRACSDGTSNWTAALF